MLIYRLCLCQVGHTSETKGCMLLYSIIIQLFNHYCQMLFVLATYFTSLFIKQSVKLSETIAVMADLTAVEAGMAQNRVRLG